MKDIRFTPKSNGKKEKAYLALYAAIAIVAFIFGMLPISGRGILQLVFVVFVAIDVMLGSKYFLSSYTYTLTDQYGENMLVITQTQGKRISTLANLAVKDIRTIALKTQKSAQEDVAKKYGPSCVRYNYVAGMKNDGNVIALTVRNDYTYYSVFLTYNEDFYRALSSAWNAREITTDED